MEQTTDEPRSERQHMDPPPVKKRTRASVACNNCRVKRSKCDGAVVGAPCSPCRKYNLHCELRQDRKRQRPSNAVLVEDLTERVKMLERLLDIKNKSNTGDTGTSMPQLHPKDQTEIHDRNADESDGQSTAHSIPTTGTDRIDTTCNATSTAASMAFPSSEDSDPDFSFTETLLFDHFDDNTFDNADVLDGFDVIASAEDGLFGWGAKNINEARPGAAEVSGAVDSQHLPVPAPASALGPVTASNTTSSIPLQEEQSGLQEKPPMDVQKKKRKSAEGQPAVNEPGAITVPAASRSNTRPVKVNTAERVSSSDTGPALTSAIPDVLIESLLDLYFTHFQTMLKIVDETTFRAARAAMIGNNTGTGGPASSSAAKGDGYACRESLVLAMAAAGARFSSDPLLETTYRAGRSSGETVFASRSKTLLESEVNHADITTVQALLILGELETSAGNDMSGCMYSGLVSRLVFDLRLDPASSQDMDLSDSERSVRHWILWYASVQDKYWAQRLCRPLTIKNMDLQLSRMIAKFSQQMSSNEQSPSPDGIIQECVLDLLELTREALEFLVGSFSFRVSVENYATVLRINSKLDMWFRNLPALVKDLSNTNNTNHFVPVLHMQYHLTKIQLFEPFAFHQHRPASSPSTSPISPSASASHLAMAHITDQCRRLGAASSVHIAKLFATFRRKYDIRCLQCSGVQYADIASHFLVKYIPLLEPDEAVEPEAHLRSLTHTLEVMAETFRPADKPLCAALDALKALEHRQRRQSPKIHGVPQNRDPLHDEAATSRPGICHPPQPILQTAANNTTPLDSLHPLSHGNTFDSGLDISLQQLQDPDDLSFLYL